MCPRLMGWPVGSLRSMGMNIFVETLCAQTICTHHCPSCNLLMKKRWTSLELWEQIGTEQSMCFDMNHWKLVDICCKLSFEHYQSWNFTENFVDYSARIGVAKEMLDTTGRENLSSIVWTEKEKGKWCITSYLRKTKSKGTSFVFVLIIITKHILNMK